MLVVRDLQAAAGRRRRGSASRFCLDCVARLPGVQPEALGCGLTLAVDCAAFMPHSPEE
ncbi:MAG: hypothetical protein K0R68_2024, partial [Mycobacterium sp.]|nr:hypothetical protein [Mycobacterium sp.]